ncbi:nucleotide exchange factor GrpE [Halobacteria archaeon AArc-dxtr1]|nr:nucleotide exchange factor GrpE [Halobacteria archaeon AArc-dxtr1]
MSEDEATNPDAADGSSVEAPENESDRITDSDAPEEAAPAAENVEQDGEEVGDEGDAVAGDESVAELNAAIEERDDQIAEYQERIEELEGKLARKQADFQNYKKRAKKRQQQIKDRATEDLVSRLLGVRDNLTRALEEEHGSVEDLREGVEMTLREFDRVLADEDVAEISPEPGSEVDPQRHEVMARVDSDEPEGTIASVFTPGYRMGEKVVQNAQVTVSNGELADAEPSDETAADAESAAGEAEATSDADEE